MESYIFKGIIKDQGAWPNLRSQSLMEECLCELMSGVRLSNVDKFFKHNFCFKIIYYMLLTQSSQDYQEKMCIYAKYKPWATDKIWEKLSVVQMSQKHAKILLGL